MEGTDIPIKVNLRYCFYVRKNYFQLISRRLSQIVFLVQTTRIQEIRSAASACYSSFCFLLEESECLQTSYTFRQLTKKYPIAKAPCTSLAFDMVSCKWKTHLAIYTTLVQRFYVYCFLCTEHLLKCTRKISRKTKIKHTKIQELWSKFDAGPSQHLSQVILIIIESK